MSEHPTDHPLLFDRGNNGKAKGTPEPHLTKKARSKGFKIIHAPLIIDPKNNKGWLS